MKKVKCFFVIFLLLFILGSPSSAEAAAIYTEDNMVLVNQAVEDELATAVLPDGIGIDLNFGEITGDIYDLHETIGKELQFVRGGTPYIYGDIDLDASGANWAEDAAEAAVDFDTFLGAVGYHLGLYLGVISENKTAATVATLEMTLSKEFLVEQGVPLSEANALFAADPIEAQRMFFDEFTYFKIFDGADPAIDPKDIVEFVKAEYPDSMPSFIEFEVDDVAETLTVAIRYILLDEAPEDGQPFVINKNFVVSEYGEYDVTGVLFIFDGNKNNELRDPVSLGSEVVPEPTPSGSSGGGCSTGLTLMLALLGLPVILYRKK
ncbi:MAG: Synerg-CTERM sorting domain-containing protein [Synergistota bacterium]|nr:Synerg-CTERM sorting domain-containing protein [Synergistota bacterium]